MLPALEAFEEMLENPTTYYIFYDYFLRAAVGEEEWKKMNGRPKRKTTKKQSSTAATNEVASLENKRLASSLDEAFALIVLRNNYFAWLLKAKEQHKNLKTDYDGGNEKEKSLAMHLLSGYLIDLEESDEGNASSYVRFKNQRQTDEEQRAAYMNARRKFIGNVMRVREKVKHSEEYKKIKESLTSLKRLRSDEDDDMLRKRKKMKMVMEMKKYTGVTLDDRRAKGWSAKAFLDMFQMKVKIEGMDEAYKRFGKAYRYVYNIYHAEIVEDDTNTTSQNDVLSDEQYKSLFNLSAEM